MARHIYIVRHTEAEPGAQADSSRKLTKTGEQQAEKLGQWLARQIGRVDIVIASPFDRTMQTAEPIAKALGAHVASTNGLEPEGRTAKYAWDEITRLMQASREVLLVGHGPALSTLCLWLMGFEGDKEELRFEYGAIARLKITDPRDRAPGKGDGKLHWLIEPELVLPPDAVVEAAEALLREAKDDGDLVRVQQVSELEGGGALWRVTPA